MVIEIERIASRNGGVARCLVAGCEMRASWSLVDRDMPAEHRAAVGSRRCCTAHIPQAYVILRGAHVVAHAIYRVGGEENATPNSPALRYAEARG